MSDRVRLSCGRGPVGTGVFLLGRRVVLADTWDARAWVVCLFVPLLPLRAARFRGPSECPIGESWEVERSSLDAPSRGDVWKTYGLALCLLLLTLGSVAVAWWTIDQTGLLEALKVVVGSSVPILVLMWCDLRVPRVGR